MSLPIVIASLIFGLNADLKVFDTILALNNGGPGTATTPLNLYMYQTSFTYSDYGYGSTIALLITVLCLAATLLVFRSSRRNLANG
jgi:multiple sugar transport system permease protein/raffinose/stachyose/melibiose transport system permease protein